VASLIVRKYLQIVLKVEISTSSRRLVTIVVLSDLFRKKNFFGDEVVSLKDSGLLKALQGSGLNNSSVVELGLLTRPKSLI
jgi:hypothetical protein